MQLRNIGRLSWLRISIIICALGLASGHAHADQLERLFAQILRDPHNIELNLRYARLAEAREEDRKALAAYERVLEADPSNREASQALHRININLIPVETTGRIELGARYETNARHLPKGSGRNDDFAGFTKLLVNDRRPLLNQEWRSDFFGYADLHDQETDIDFWIARAHTGPVFGLSGDATFQIAPGGAVSFLDGDWYYAEPALRLTFENLFNGLLSRLDFRGAYRGINSDSNASKGIALDVIARHISRELVTETDLLVIQPFFRYRRSDSGDVGPFGLLNTFVLGDYIEVGGQVQYFVQPWENVRIGGKFLGYYRDYDQIIRLGFEERYDYFIAPGAEILFRNVACEGCDIKADYRFEQNFSNDDSEDFSNHVIGLSGIKRF